MNILAQLISFRHTIMAQFNTISNNKHTMCHNCAYVCVMFPNYYKPIFHKSTGQISLFY